MKFLLLIPRPLFPGAQTSSSTFPGSSPPHSVRTAGSSFLLHFISTASFPPRAPTTPCSLCHPVRPCWDPEDQGKSTPCPITNTPSRSLYPCPGPTCQPLLSPPGYPPVPSEPPWLPVPHGLCVSVFHTPNVNAVCVCENPENNDWLLLFFALT